MSILKISPSVIKLALECVKQDNTRPPPLLRTIHYIIKNQIIYNENSFVKVIFIINYIPSYFRVTRMASSRKDERVYGHFILNIIIHYYLAE